MELRGLKKGASLGFPRTASRHDPQECGALRQGNIPLIHSAPTRERLHGKTSHALACRGVDVLTAQAARRGWPDKPAMTRRMKRRKKASVPAVGLLHLRELLGAGRTLMGRLPGLVGHAVDRLAAFILAHRDAPGVGFVLEPVGQAVAAEAREIHQVDVLEVAAGAQMFDKAPESGGFKFCSGFVVNRHVRGLVLLRKLADIRWVFPQLPKPA